MNKEKDNIKFWEQNKTKISKTNKKWNRVLLYIGLFILIGFISFVLTAAISNTGWEDSLMFFLVIISCYGIIYEIGRRNRIIMLSHILAIALTIVAICIIWNTAFNYRE